MATVKKPFKKPVKKAGATKKAAKPAKPAKKAAALKKPVKKLTLKKPAPPKIVKKPAIGKPVKKAKAATEEKPKRQRKEPKAPSYRSLRKWTVPKLRPFLEQGGVMAVREKIRSVRTGALLASELLDFLTKCEKDMPDWAAKRAASGTATKAKPGPKPKSKDPIASKKPAPKKLETVQDPKAVLAKAAAGNLLPKAPPKPPGAAKPVFKVPKLAQA